MLQWPSSDTTEALDELRRNWQTKNLFMGCLTTQEDKPLLTLGAASGLGETEIHVSNVAEVCLNIESPAPPTVDDSISQVLEVEGGQATDIPETWTELSADALSLLYENIPVTNCCNIGRGVTNDRFEQLINEIHEMRSDTNILKELVADLCKASGVIRKILTRTETYTKEQMGVQNELNNTLVDTLQKLTNNL